MIYKIFLLLLLCLVANLAHSEFQLEDSLSIAPNFPPDIIDPRREVIQIDQSLIKEKMEQLFSSSHCPKTAEKVRNRERSKNVSGNQFILFEPTARQLKGSVTNATHSHLVFCGRPLLAYPTLIRTFLMPARARKKTPLEFSRL